MKVAILNITMVEEGFIEEAFQFDLASDLWYTNPFQEIYWMRFISKFKLNYLINFSLDIFYYCFNQKCYTLRAASI